MRSVCASLARCLARTAYQESGDDAGRPVRERSGDGVCYVNTKSTLLSFFDRIFVFE